MSGAPAIRVEGLTKSFGSVRAVDGISFEVRRGGITALLGGNGAGKTTTISMLLGILTPTAGNIFLLGSDMSRERHQALGRMNFSSPYLDLPKKLTVRENLTIYGRLYGVRDIVRRIDTLAQELDLGDLLDRPFGRLSAGQQTRVSLSKSLLNEPELLLMDEPTASLDPDTADRIRGYFMAYKERTGATIFMASHNMREVERLCDNVLMMRRGRIVAGGSPSELMARHGHGDMEAVFIDLARNAGGEVAA